MTNKSADKDVDLSGSNLSYPQAQLAKAIGSSTQHEDEILKQRAQERATKWQATIEQIRDGQLEVGSRTPLHDVPAWATLEVLTGGFASGHLLAGGALQEHEKQLLARCGEVAAGDERLALNLYFLSAAGLADLHAMLHSACYEIKVPEEAALPIIAWLYDHDEVDLAQQLLTEITPFFHQLRFYPIPLAQARQFGSRVHVQNVGETVAKLKFTPPNPRVLAQKEAVEIWAPFYDRMLALILETAQADQYGQHFPADWQHRATSLLQEFTMLRKQHQRCSKPDKRKFYFAQLRALLEQALQGPLSAAQSAHAAKIVRDSLAKRGPPDAKVCQQQRQRQQADVSAPSHEQLAQLLVTRLSLVPKDAGLDEVQSYLQPVNTAEASATLAASCPIPDSLQRKVERCLNELVTVLVERGLITSGEMLAKMLPQMTASIRAAGIKEPLLRALYAASYRAFRNRRSLLLLNLEHQVQIEELPWIKAIENHRHSDISSVETARQTLVEICTLAFSAFPYAILPNKLLQELRALAHSAQLEIPLVDELAVDIFMGQFSKKFLAAAHISAGLLRDTLYARYYKIDFEQLPTAATPDVAMYDASRKATYRYDPLTMLCSSRAGVALGGYSTARNGMIIEQQQILTTQNLASLFVALDLSTTLKPQIYSLAKTCFIWICQRHQMKVDTYHDHLIVIKNTAYAWRQMVFFLALVPASEQTEFFEWANARLKLQIQRVQLRLGPALRGLQLAASDASDINLPPYFRGWSKEKHWMMSVGE